jgi:hypothetical protein
MAAKRKIPTHAERASQMPPAERKAYRENFWRDHYLPNLTKEKPGRVKRFLRSRHDHFDLYEDLLLGYEWRVTKDAQDFLLLCGSIGIRLPPHFAQLQEERPVPPHVDGTASIKHTLKARIESPDGHFFGDIDSLLATLPERMSVTFFDEVETALRDGKKLATGAKGHGARSYIQRLIFVLLEIHIRCLKRLPTVSELRDAVKRLMPRPPGKQAFDNALNALGLAPPLLLPK